MDVGHSLLLEFDGRGREFAMGVEVGRTWEMLRHIAEAFDCEVHTTNAEMMIRLGEATDRTVYWKEHDGTWATVYFGPAPPE